MRIGLEKRLKKGLKYKDRFRVKVKERFKV